MKSSIYSYTLDALDQLLVENGFSTFNAKQIFQWVYKQNNLEVASWSNVSKKLKEFLKNSVDFNYLSIAWQGESKDKTKKYLLKLNDKNTIEAVVIPAKNRQTMCLSSQVGCAIGCTFCHTGTQGLTRHLSVGEIVGQFMTVQNEMQKEGKDLTNIVYMGQGEPLHNFENTKRSIQIFLEPMGIGLGQRKVTLSTSGLVPQIEKLNDFPPINIAISLHAAHNKMRSELMPINQVYNLERLFAAIKRIPIKAHRYITYEYLLIDNYNDRLEDIEALCRLINSKESKINIIPFNEYPQSKFKRPSKSKTLWFNGELVKRGQVSTVRKSMGTDILAACGQLKSEHDGPNIWPS